MKRILGLDLGTTSIGWAFVNEAEKDNEESSIIKTGVRVVPLSTDEENDFKKGNSITINADRTLKRGARRNKFRYQLRRKALIKELKNIGFINENTKLTETGNNSTHELLRLRNRAVIEKMEKDEFARILLSINKKRGYKSSRKANSSEEGELIDAMGITKKLYEQNLTPGEFSYQLLKEGKKAIPDYYRSDLENEFDKVWKRQKTFYPDILNKILRKELVGKNKNQTWKICENPFDIEGIKLEGNRDEKKLEKFRLRKIALTEQIDLEHLAIVLQEINNEINKSSGYLSEISDRSKELHFNNLTVGQYLYNQIAQNPHKSLKNQVFYRQDYLIEFQKIWDKQAEFYPALTEKLKDKIQNEIIFYQRRLKSQKGLISYCEFESWEQNATVDGQVKHKTVGHRVIPKSSPLFQEFKVWQNLNSIRIIHIKTNEVFHIEEDSNTELFQKLNWTDKLTNKQVLKEFNLKPEDWKINFQQIEGNRTNYNLLAAYKEILKIEGYDNINFSNIEPDELQEILEKCFGEIGIDKQILDFNATLDGNEFSKQKSYELWHLLYSYEDDFSRTGTEALENKLKNNFGFKDEHLPYLINIRFQDDYGNLSARAIRKIMPYLQDGKIYSDACELAGYNHSNSVTKKQNEKRVLKPKLEILKKNSLRNPVVEKILNQCINVINTIIEDEKMGRPDEIRIELARELKNTKEQRDRMTKAIGRATREHEKYREEIKSKFGLPHVSRNDLIRYKLYKELESNGYRTLYTDEYIKPEDLFSKNYDIEHIIPKSRLFDDSFSNKTLETRESNLDKGDETALDFVERKFGKEGLDNYRNRVEELYKARKIKGSKHQNLLMSLKDIPEDFLNRDLGNSAYIAKKAAEILLDVTKRVSLTSGKITSKLRDDWGLIQIMQELNWDKYEKVGLTYYKENKEGKKLRRIKEWTKRNDHRHHAMDAITVAFTKPGMIQYLNNLNAKTNKEIYKLENTYTYKDDRGKRKFKAPFPNIRKASKKHLSQILISHKAKNKVTTKNKNKINVKGKNTFVYQTVETPRGQLHKETVYGKSKYYETKFEKVSGKFDEDRIELVANQSHKNALLKRLEEFENNPKKAFTGKNSLAKNPVYLNGTQETLPEKVKLAWLEDRFTIRKEITPDLKTDKILDKGVKKILEERLKEFNNKPKEAFADLDKNPIWLNEEKGIKIKRVKITGVSNAEALHHSKNHLGKQVLDDKNSPIPNDYVSTGNNHHVAIYEDEKGNLQEEVVSFYEAVARKKEGLPIINKKHEKGWMFLFTMKQNEMFVFPNEEKGFNPSEIDLLNPNNKVLISENLFRVQKIATKNYFFRHHLETQLIDHKKTRTITWENIRSCNGLKNLVKIRLNHLGEIVQVGEY
ncbi:type II CRISPR RNA-guided endonuclease Cas9 [Mesonia mobilis]|uniref:CRISPR-associated endonuclease Cas9 n=1 Tax=Mesonia mobilis TaxID=369791 RepID=A0ABQ3BZ65_9FLAO|nr:type II CRISPR RNA-guided endonuclease Cas9 [Mesonia mobilis]MBQ0738088.1 type II CRISPR RNA-guided endonuclease Cas9 [Aquimarina celericrescens]GGZ61656.1 CRISPR-associated endonuclease Cas9 [Mesonia mobilis]